MHWLQMLMDNFSEQSSLLFWSVISCYILYYLFQVVKKPLIATAPNGLFYEFIEKCMPVTKESFWPTMWCIESRAQTVIPTFVRSLFMPPVPYKRYREILLLEDGGEICLDTLDPKLESSSSCPTIILLPGITGSSEAEYSKHFALTAKDLGIRTVVMSHRGIGIKIKTTRMYCASNCDDFVDVLTHVKNKYEGSLLGAVGISMGGMVLGKYLTTVGREKSPLSCAMIISVPYDVHLNVRCLDTPYLNLLLNKHLASCMRDIVSTNQHLFEPNVLEEIFKSQTITDINRSYVVKYFGYKDIDAYHDDACLHNKLHEVTIPLLCLSAADDPFQPMDGIPINVVNKMDNVCIIVTARGGHIGFMDGIFPFRKNQYMFRVFSQYFKSMLVDGRFNDFSQPKKLV